MELLMELVLNTLYVKPDKEPKNRFYRVFYNTTDNELCMLSFFLSPFTKKLTNAVNTITTKEQLQFVKDGYDYQNVNLPELVYWAENYNHGDLSWDLERILSELGRFEIPQIYKAPVKVLDVLKANT